MGGNKKLYKNRFKLPKIATAALAAGWWWWVVATAVGVGHVWACGRACGCGSGRGALREVD
jgi:hypothetical protein